MSNSNARAAGEASQTSVQWPAPSSVAPISLDKPVPQSTPHWTATPASSVNTSKTAGSSSVFAHPEAPARAAYVPQASIASTTTVAHSPASAAHAVSNDDSTSKKPSTSLHSIIVPADPFALKQEMFYHAKSGAERAVNFAYVPSSTWTTTYAREFGGVRQSNPSTNPSVPLSIARSESSQVAPKGIVDHPSRSVPTAPASQPNATSNAVPSQDPEVPAKRTDPFNLLPVHAEDLKQPFVPTTTTSSGVTAVPATMSTTAAKQTSLSPSELYATLMQSTYQRMTAAVAKPNHVYPGLQGLPVQPNYDRPTVEPSEATSKMVPQNIAPSPFAAFAFPSATGGAVAAPPGKGPQSYNSNVEVSENTELRPKVALGQGLAPGVVAGVPTTLIPRGISVDEILHAETPSLQHQVSLRTSTLASTVHAAPASTIPVPPQEPSDSNSIPQSAVGQSTLNSLDQLRNQARRYGYFSTFKPTTTQPIHIQADEGDDLKAAAISRPPQTPVEPRSESTVVDTPSTALNVPPLKETQTVDPIYSTAVTHTHYTPRPEKAQIVGAIPLSNSSPTVGVWSAPFETRLPTSSTLPHSTTADLRVYKTPESTATVAAQALGTSAPVVDKVIREATPVPVRTSTPTAVRPSTPASTPEPKRPIIPVRYVSPTGVVSWVSPTAMASTAQRPPTPQPRPQAPLGNEGNSNPSASSADLALTKAASHFAPNVPIHTPEGSAARFLPPPNPPTWAERKQLAEKVLNPSQSAATATATADTAVGSDSVSTTAGSSAPVGPAWSRATAFTAPPPKVVGVSTPDAPVMAAGVQRDTVHVPQLSTAAYLAGATPAPPAVRPIPEQDKSTAYTAHSTSKTPSQAGHFSEDRLTIKTLQRAQTQRIVDWKKLDPLTESKLSRQRWDKLAENIRF